MLLQWKFWPTQDSYLRFKKNFFSFFKFRKRCQFLLLKTNYQMASHFTDVKCRFHWRFSMQYSCSTCNCKRSAVTAIRLLMHWWVWLSRIHQLHSYAMRNHSSMIHDSNLTLSFCKSAFGRLNRISGTSMNCHRVVAGYDLDLLGRKVFLLSFVYSKQSGSFFLRQVFHILVFALRPWYGRLAKRFGNAKYQYLPSLNCRGHCECKTPLHCWYWRYYRNCYH